MFRDLIANEVINLNNNIFRLVGGVPHEKLSFYVTTYLWRADTVIAYLLRNYKDFEVNVENSCGMGKFMFVKRGE